MPEKIEADNGYTGPTPNSFKKFSTMTYSVSIYLQSPAHFQKMMNEAKGFKSVDGLKLLIQSGGITDGNTGNFGATRSEFFPEDFYLDNIQFKSLVSGTSTSAAHNTYEMNFNVVEPNGITFLERLDAAIQDYNVNELKLTAGDINFISQTYLMVIRFYGYDENNNMIRRTDNETDVTSDRRATDEKFIPFMFTGITFKLETDTVVYACSAVPPQSQIANDKTHGVIPKNINLQGKTLEEVFNGPGGLVETLNNEQEKLKEEGLYDEVDEYSVEFQTTSKLAKSSVLSPGTTLHAITGAPDITKADRLIKKGKVDSSTKMYASNAGMRITNFLDMTIRSSSFITDQYTEIHDRNKENTTKITEKDPKFNLNWFKINFRLEVLKYDKKRGNFAYKIIFVISDYAIHSIDSSPYFSNDACPDIIKEYDYWFTGLNTEVLEFSQEYNFLYYTSFGSKKVNNSSLKQPIINGRSMVYQANSREANSEKGTDEQAANYASILYSPADQATAEIVIVGDPDWIAQSEIFYPSDKDTASGLLSPDGSINYNTTEVFFSINYNTVVDYDLNTGLADVTAKNVGVGLASDGGVSQHQLVYRANGITTRLNGGQFTQRLEGTIKFIPPACIKKSAEATNRPDSNTKTPADRTKLVGKSPGRLKQG